VGPAKTGTSAVQHVLRGVQGGGDSLVVYPEVGLSRGGSHNDLVANLIGDHSRPDVTRVDQSKLLADLQRVLGGSERDVVISSEALAGRHDMGRLIESLTQLFDGSVRVELIIVCREHFGRAASAYNQRVKDGWLRERESPDVFLRGRGAAFRYQEIIGRLKRPGIAVKALNYHPASSLVERFMRHLGFPQERIPAAEMRNISLSPKGLVATLAANNVAATPGDRERYFAALRKMRRFFAPSKFIFSADAAREVSRRLQSDREFLESEMGIALPPPDFPPMECGLYLEDREFEEICEVTRALGDEGRAIADYAARFRRAKP
jgi:hypothetical protein